MYALYTTTATTTTIIKLQNSLTAPQRSLVTLCTGPPSPGQILVSTEQILVPIASLPSLSSFFMSYKWSHTECTLGAWVLSPSTLLRFIHVEPLVTQLVKKSPAIQETGVQSLGQEDPLEQETATHFSVLAWRTVWTEEPGGLQSMGPQDTAELLKQQHTLLH